MAETRRAILNTAAALLAEQGYHATGINQIVEQSGAPRGSLYYYFPGGKEQLAVEAVERSAARLEARIRENMAADPDPLRALERFIDRIAEGVELSGFRAGGPLSIVTMESATTNEALNRACRLAYGRMRAAFAESLAEADLPIEPDELAMLVTAAIEGGILLSRAEHSADALRAVGRLLGGLLGSSSQA